MLAKADADRLFGGVRLEIVEAFKRQVATASVGQADLQLIFLAAIIDFAAVLATDLKMPPDRVAAILDESMERAARHGTPLPANRGRVAPGRERVGGLIIAERAAPRFR